VAITLPVDDPDAAARAGECPFGPGAARRAADIETIRAGGHAVIELTTADALASRFEGIGPATAGVISFGVRDVSAAGRVLARNAVPHIQSGNAVVSASTLGTVAVRFVAN